MINEETYVYIDKLLDLGIANISESQYEMLVEDYFKKDKINWIKNSGEKKIWDENKVNIFWKLIRRIVMPKGKKTKFMILKDLFFLRLKIHS